MSKLIIFKQKISCTIKDLFSTILPHITRLHASKATGQNLITLINILSWRTQQLPGNVDTLVLDENIKIVSLETFNVEHQECKAIQRCL